MNVLIWGSDTILGHGLLSMLKDIKDGVFNAIGNIEIGEIFACDAESDKDVIDEACANADFVFNLSYGFKSDKLIEGLNVHNNTCPVLLGHSVGETWNSSVSKRKSMTCSAHCSAHKLDERMYK